MNHGENSDKISSCTGLCGKVPFWEGLSQTLAMERVPDWLLCPCMDNHGVYPKFVLYPLYASIIFPDKYSEKKLNKQNVIINNTKKTLHLCIVSQSHPVICMSSYQFRVKKKMNVGFLDTLLWSFLVKTIDHLKWNSKLNVFCLFAFFSSFYLLSEAKSWYSCELKSKVFTRNLMVKFSAKAKFTLTKQRT